MPTDAEIKMMAARELFEREFRRHIRPEDGQIMRELQRLARETEALRAAAAKPKPRPDDLGHAIARIGEVAVQPEPEPPSEEPPYTVDDAIRELRAADRGRRG